MGSIPIPIRIRILLADIKKGRDIPALPLLDMPSMEYRALLQVFKKSGYVCVPGSGYFTKHETRKKNLH